MLRIFITNQEKLAAMLKITDANLLTSIQENQSCLLAELAVSITGIPDNMWLIAENKEELERELKDFYLSETEDELESLFYEDFLSETVMKTISKLKEYRNPPAL